MKYLFTSTLTRLVSSVARRFPSLRRPCRASWLRPVIAVLLALATTVADGLAQNLTVNPTRGTQFSAPISVALGGQPTIYYTTDGSVPSAVNGSTYTVAIPISQTTVLRAVGSAAGSVVQTHTYIFPGDVVAQPEMDPTIVGHPIWGQTIQNDLNSIPTLSIAMNHDDLFGTANGIYANAIEEGIAWERACSAEYLPAVVAERFQVNCGIRIQGGFSRQATPKNSLRLIFRNIYGPGTLDADLFPESTVDEFNGLSLHAHFNDHWFWIGQNAQFQRDQWARDTHNDMGGFGARGRYVHLYLNGVYWGLYNMGERPDGVWAANNLGGTEEEQDVLKTPPGQAGDPEVLDGNLIAWNAMYAIADGIANGSIPPEQAMSRLGEYLDVPDFIDYMMLNFYGANWDWPGNNWTAVRRRVPGAGFHFIVNDAEYLFGIPPCCDPEGRFAGINDDRTIVDGDSARSGFYYGRPSVLYHELRKDPEFNRLFGDRAHRHLFNNGALTPAQVDARWMARADEMHHAVVPESARWGDIAGGPFTVDDWQAEQNRLRSVSLSPEFIEQGWFQHRTGIFLGHLRNAGLYPLIEAPSFTPFGGRLLPNAQLTLDNPNGFGTIYYTLDGSDPRLVGGALAPSARAYSSPITINGYVLLQARVLDDAGQWSALVQAPFNVHQSGLVISEIMYHPPATPAFDSDDFEFLELKNIGSVPVDLTGLRFTAGINFTFRNGTFLAPGAFLVLVRDQEAFSSRYPGVATYGLFTGKLDNRQDTLSVSDSVGAFLTVAYQDRNGWPGAPDGDGPSLTRVNYHGNVNLPVNWRASLNFGGTPGADGLAPIHSLNSEFPLTANPEPGGRWACGYLTALEESFVPVNYFYGNSAADDGTLVPAWQLDLWRSPAFYYNSSGRVITTGGGAVTSQPGDVWFLGGEDGEPENYGAIRYTVLPGEAGVYQIVSRVQAYYADWFWTGDTDFHVLHNGQEIYGSFLAPGGSAGFTRTLNLAEFDTIDFVIGRGADGSQYASVAKLWAELQQVSAPANPGPPSSPNLDYSLDSNPLPGGRWTLGYSEAIGSAFVPVTFADPNSTADDGTPVPCWQPDLWRSPAFYCNVANHTINAGGGIATFVPRTLWVAAGDDGYPENYGVVRYTVPAGQSGLHTIGAIIESVYLTWNIGDTDFHILNNGVEIEGGNVPAGGSGISGLTVYLAAGDTIDLVVGRGADCLQYASGLKIWAAVTRLP